MRRKEGDIFIVDKPFIEQFTKLNRVVKFTDSIVFRSFIILKNNNVFYLLVPDREVYCS